MLASPQAAAGSVAPAAPCPGLSPNHPGRDMTQQATSRSIILREAEFAERLTASAVHHDVLAQARGLVHAPEDVRQNTIVVGLVTATHALESFLDDHGARQNRHYATFGELVASLRGVASVRATALHVLHRLPHYGVDEIGEELPRDLNGASSTLDRFVVSLCRRLLEEAELLGVSTNPDEERAPIAAVEAPRHLLPRDLDAADAADERQHLAEIAARFQSILHASRNLQLGEKRTAEELVKFVAVSASEERCRWYESAVHNIQSMYDTWVHGTSLEQQEPWLIEFRGRISVALHMLEMATSLTHFYERHESEDRHEPAREAIANAVPRAEVLDLAVNVCLRQAYLFVESCADLARRIIETFVSESTVRLTLPDGLVLHARPLALIVKVARRHATPVEIIIDGESCSASSLMSLIMLGGKHPKPGSIEAKGDARALSDLALLFEAGLGENGPLPADLDYLAS